MFKIPMMRPKSITVGPCAPDAKAALCDASAKPTAEQEPLPPALADTAEQERSPAQWAYERMILYIQNFEKQLDEEHEVGMGFVSGGGGMMRITGMGYFAPDLVTFYGVDESGAKTQLIQHVSQLNVMLKSAPKMHEEPTRIGFELSKGLENPTTAQPSS